MKTAYEKEILVKIKFS